MSKKQLCIELNISDGRLNLIHCNADAMEESPQYLCILLGEMFSPHTFCPISCAQAIAEYSLIGPGMVTQIDGLYTLLIYDKLRNRVDILQDPTSSKHTVYYTMANGRFFCCTDLKLLLYYSRIARSVNQSVLPCLVRNFCVMSKDTIVSGVYKLMPNMMLHADRYGVRLSPRSYCVLNPKGTDSETLRSIIRDYLAACVPIQPNKELHLALSSGYDSNLILSQAEAVVSGKLHGYTIGSTCAGSEVPVVEKISGYYKNLTLHSDIVGTDSFQILPDLVWRLEGAVHENGVVLQYLLARKARESACKHILCGESADEIMYSAYLDVSQMCDMDLLSRIRIPFSKNPFFSTNLVVLKKSSIILNSFGITPHYPFKNSRFISFGRAISHQNQNQKSEYKRLCSELIRPEVYLHLASSGGATDPRALLNEERVAYFARQVQQSQFSHQFTWCDLPVSTLIKTCFSPTVDGFELASDLLSGICLLLFEELFISQKYDSEFICDGFRATTSDLFQEIW